MFHRAQSAMITLCICYYLVYFKELFVISKIQNQFKRSGREDRTQCVPIPTSITLFSIDRINRIPYLNIYARLLKTFFTFFAKKQPITTKRPTRAPKQTFQAVISTQKSYVNTTSHQKNSNHLQIIQTTQPTKQPKTPFTNTTKIGYNHYLSILTQSNKK